MGEEKPEEEVSQGSDIGCDSEELKGLLGATSKKSTPKSKPLPDVSAFGFVAPDSPTKSPKSPRSPESGFKVSLRGTGQEMKGNKSSFSPSLYLCSRCH
jgi:hypothetical protein